MNDIKKINEIKQLENFLHEDLILKSGRETITIIMTILTLIVSFIYITDNEKIYFWSSLSLLFLSFIMLFSSIIVTKRIQKEIELLEKLNKSILEEIK